MKYLNLIWAAGVPTEEDLAVMNRDLPGYLEEMSRRGVRLFGRELDLPDTAVTVRVRGGEPLVSDGPFVETKEFLAGFDLLECEDQAEAVEVSAAGPVARFLPMEIRPFPDGGVALGDSAFAFGRGEDGGRTPYLLSVWTSGIDATAPETLRAITNWRLEAEDRGLLVFGSALAGPGSATTLRVREGTTSLSDGPYIANGVVLSAIEVISAGNRQQAIDLALTHPAAREHAIEVRPFYCE